MSISAHHHQSWGSLLIFAFPLFLDSCSKKEPDPCATTWCGECPSAVEVTYIDRNTGLPIGTYKSIHDLTIEGADGYCGDLGSCDVYATDRQPDTLYQFDIVYQGTVIDSFSTTPAMEHTGICCNCGYATRVVEVEVDGELFHQGSTNHGGSGGLGGSTGSPSR